MPGIAELCQLNPLTAYLFDKAVTTFGLLIKNALQEYVEGANKRSRPRYKLNELLEDDFKFPREDNVATFRTIEGYKEVG